MTLVILAAACSSDSESPSDTLPPVSEVLAGSQQTALSWTKFNVTVEQVREAESSCIHRFHQTTWGGDGTYWVKLEADGFAGEEIYSVDGTVYGRSRFESPWELVEGTPSLEPFRPDRVVDLLQRIQDPTLHVREIDAGRGRLVIEGRFVPRADSDVGIPDETDVTIVISDDDFRVFTVNYDLKTDQSVCNIWWRLGGFDTILLPPTPTVAAG